MNDYPSVMIVEDERIIAFDMKLELESLGYRVPAVVPNGEQALERAAELRPDIVLMDIHLEGGGMDGIEAARRLQEDLCLPVIFVTAYAEDDILRRAQASLPYGYLTKPAQRRELHATLQMAVARHQVEDQLWRSEERLRLALRAAELGVWEWNPDTDRVTAAGYVETLFGVNAEPISESFEAFIARVAPEDRERIGMSLARVRELGAAVDIAFRAYTEGGRLRWIEAHARAFAPTRLRPACLIGVLRDVTERRETEDRLRQAGAILETTAEGIYILDLSGRIVSVNPAFCGLTGYGAEQVTAMDPVAVMRLRGRNEPFDPARQSLVLGQRGQVQAEARYLCSDGSTFAAWESVSVVRNAMGEATHFVVAFSDVSAMRRVQEQLNHLAHHDPLTGLPNRALFNDRCEQALERARRDGQSCALVFLDLDGFKHINDTLGHAIGDSLLRTIAVRIQGNLRRCDTAARLGGDEFVVIVGDLEHAEDCGVLVRKLLDRIAAPVRLGEDWFSVSASAGVAVFPGDGEDRHALLMAADTAMYMAKAQGRNRYCYHTGEMAARAAERLNIEQGLQRALEQGELLVHYQPQVRVSDGAVIGVEALVRWCHPREGLIAPLRFIGVAEDCGLIEPMGRWVLRQSCSEIARWNAASGRALRLSVNVSARQLSRDGFAATLREALAESGFPASLLELELTETTLQLIEHRPELIEELKAVGVTIAIDDFGTGYSSLSVLRHLPIDRLKIDRAFVRDVPGRPDALAIVQAIHALSRTLGMAVIAEGVETHEQLAALRAIGCDEAQGYLFSPPLAFATFQALPPTLAP